MGRLFWFGRRPFQVLRSNGDGGRLGAGMTGEKVAGWGRNRVRH